MTDRHGVIAYLATITAIVVLALAGALVCILMDAETHLAQIVAALGFIGAGVTGLIGVIGTFRPRTNGGDATGKPDDPVNVTPAEESPS